MIYLFICSRWLSTSCFFFYFRLPTYLQASSSLTCFGFHYQQTNCPLSLILFIQSFSVRECFRSFISASFPTYYDLCWLLILAPCITANVCHFDTLSYRCQLNARSPGVSISAFWSCSLCIYVLVFCAVSGFCFLCNIAHTNPPLIQFLFVSSTFCRQLPSDSSSRRTPLLLANTSCCKAYSGLAPYSRYTCPAHRVGR